MPDPSEANSGQFIRLERSIARPHASRRGDHRGRRPDHDDTGISTGTRESLISLLSHRRGSNGATVGVHRDIKAPAGKAVAPPGRS